MNLVRCARAARHANALQLVEPWVTIKKYCTIMAAESLCLCSGINITTVTIYAPGFEVVKIGRWFTNKPINGIEFPWCRHLTCHLTRYLFEKETDYSRKV